MIRIGFAACLAGMLMASAAVAQIPGAQAVDAQPRILREPTDKETAAVMSKEAKADGVQGVAVVRCRAGARGDLESCMVESETPEDYGLGQAALKLTSRFKVEAGSPGARLRIPVVLRGPERLKFTAVSPDSQLRVLYPPKASGPGVGVVRCQAGDSGRFMGCSVAAEEPTGVGFGGAALAAATDYKFEAKDSAGRDAAMRMFVLPMRFAGPVEPAKP